MLGRKFFIIVVLIINIIAVCYSTIVFAEGEGDTFYTSVSPEVLFVLDISGSMKQNPAGGSNEYGATDGNCIPDTSKCCTSLDDPPNNGYCSSKKSGCSRNCTKLEILKRTVFNILNADETASWGQQVVDHNDDDALNIDIGYMRFWGCLWDDLSNDTYNGCIQIPGLRILNVLYHQTIGQPYQFLYCGIGFDLLFNCHIDDYPSSVLTECMTDYFANWGSFLNSSTGGTPIASSLRKAKAYLQSRPIGNACTGFKQKFAILITDGEDTLSCGGSGSESQGDQYKRRRADVYAAKVLKDAGFKLFVVGVGSNMPDHLKNTLNWMAYWGGTEDTGNLHSGDISKYTVQATDVNIIGDGTGNNNTGCVDSATISSTGVANCTSSPSGNPCFATSHDPGDTTSSPLSGYAYISGNEDELVASLKSVFGIVAESTYSFTQTSIQTTRTPDENYIYQASFQNLNSDPFWFGHLSRYSINSNSGEVNSSPDWDAGEILQKTSASSRNILMADTSATNGLKSFTANVANIQLGITATGSTGTNQRTKIVDFVSGGDNAYAADNTYYGWKLGDIFRSSPQSVGTPSETFMDTLDTTNNAYNTFSNNHIRTSNTSTGNAKRIILVGGNDGQLHAFKTGDISGRSDTTHGGSEAWSFIPPNFISSLQYIAHTAHPAKSVINTSTTLSHKYFIDGPTSASDVWFQNGDSGSAKLAGNWYTYLITAEGRGGNQNQWSRYASCICPSTATSCTTSGTTPAYALSYSASTYNNYCGYYVLDITDTLNPIFKWNLGGGSSISSTDGPYLGDPWSKMFIGRVSINNAEKWVGFIGGGYSGTSGSACTSSSCADTSGKGFFVVDLSNGMILWRYTRANNTTYMNYDLAGNPVAVDSDGDGYLDTVYIGDSNANVWRMKLCLKSDGTSCNTTSSPGWSGSLLFRNTSTTNKQAIYTEPAVVKASTGDTWIYFGTGDKTAPKYPSSADSFYALKDNDRSTTYTSGNLRNITTSTYTDTDTSEGGWYINLAPGEKVLGAPVVYNKNLYFTTYVASDCSSKIYEINYITGAGTLNGNNRSEDTTVPGIVPGAVISCPPDRSKQADVYVGIHRINDAVPGNIPGKSLRYWKDLRLK
ncbi:MAG: PilC/PilY family type IV pilus protein [Deltaproteobacteria bacterium]|nr:PilC/PilY family type IV pilus protein [Deltaproteobacteria bacterium]